MKTGVQGEVGYILYTTINSNNSRRSDLGKKGETEEAFCQSRVFILASVAESVRT